MAKSKPTPAEGLSALNPGWNAYQMTLAGLVLPVRLHWAFDAVAGACIALLGHPLVGGCFFLVAGLSDTVQQKLIGRWSAVAADADPSAGLRRIAGLCFARMTVYVVPTLALAVTGGLKELIYFGVQLCSLVILAQANGSLSRIVFWGVATPLLMAAAALILWSLPAVPAMACMVALGILVLLLWLISQSTYQSITTWHAAFNANIDMVQELQSTRDRAVAEREAADRAREEARRANRAKSNFLATMSHEIRTPMNGVLGMAQLLKRDEIDPAQSARLDVLIESGEYLLSILNDILDVSKIDAGRLELVTGPENLHQFLDRMVGFWTPRAEERRVDLALIIRGRLPELVMMDALRMRQVMFNLVGNALKFTDEGSVQIIAEARPKGREVSLVHFAVRDTGPGIAADHLPILFERFSQADGSEMRRHGGTGLGLAIAKQLTELMGGRIWVESKLGAGATFHIEVPLRTAQADAPEAPAQPAAPTPALAEGLRVLCVDDNAVNLLVLEQLLASLGHAIVKAPGGPEALELLQAQAFDLVLLDIQMPGISGIEVLQRLRATPGPNRTAPVLALTADVTSGGRDRYMELGFTEHASKPIQLVELIQAMARALAAVVPEPVAAVSA